MNEYIANLLDAIETEDDADLKKSAFIDAINNKLVDALDSRRIEVSGNIFNNIEQED